ncbi:aminotransferase-like domain-containing protein [Saccharothrix yanglingensis]|uniref:GntR family transcriptional regulator n=1 Tax=Saccharothrix yanglingensis TaxID=659496 RepID=A0ABU0WVZ1_9PSEU|nr:PLP-dependent aminotransferase family protein [Saccharothrix yanglingensis]MDQ2584021.1 GntR family transcriptional regulator [Saccharothrix yanglingensis]
MDHRVIADRIAADIAAGRLEPGDRLPPQRRFARRHGIAASTAARVYGELARRGLTTGEVGRGTFVRSARPAEPALPEPGGARVDLEFNFCLLPDQTELLAPALRGLVDDGLVAATTPVGVAGTPEVRAATAALLARGGWAPDPRQVLFTGNGRQAIAAAVAALVPVGGRLGVEAVTYPVVKALAARLGITLVPLAVDDAGVLPDALRAADVRAAYLQPVLHNPLGTTVPPARRAELAEVVRDLDVQVVEDAVYAFLGPDLPPLAPERTTVVDSLSKRLAPGLTLGFVVPPGHLVDRVAATARSGGWAAGHFALAAAGRWLADGTVRAVVDRKRALARERQLLARTHLAGFEVRGDPGAFHCWWRLPEGWRAETFTAAASRRGIAITPAAAFAVVPGHAPNAVRLALASTDEDTLVPALTTLAALARGAPEDEFPD